MEFLRSSRAPDPPPLPPMEQQQNAKQHLLTACDANNWQTPKFASTTLGHDCFECTVTMADGPLAGQRFVGRGRRRVAAESMASTSAVNALKALMPSPRAAEGALQALRALAVKEGLRLQVEGCSVAIGRKSRVLSLAGPVGLGLSHWTQLSQTVWARGQGLRQRDCADEAASRVVAQLESEAWSAWRPQEGCGEYSRSQAWRTQRVPRRVPTHHHLPTASHRLPTACPLPSTTQRTEAPLCRFPDCALDRRRRGVRDVVAAPHVR